MGGVGGDRAAAAAPVDRRALRGPYPRRGTHGAQPSFAPVSGLRLRGNRLGMTGPPPDREHATEPVAPGGGEPVAPASTEATPPGAAGRGASAKRTRRPGVGGMGVRLETALLGLLLTAGIIGIGVGIGALLVSQKVDGWIVGLVVAVVSVLLSSMLWSSQRR